jgi:hypothetical protein
MQSTRTKILVLASLVAIWAFLFFFRQSSEPPVRSTPSQTAPRTPRTGGGSGAMSGLKTDLLNVPRPPYPAEVQNIFSSPPPPPPPQPALGAGAVAAPPPPPPDPFQEEAKQLRYVGFLQAGTTATAFIVRGQEVHTVPVGELLGARFRVMEVREDSVLLASATGDKQVRLSLAGEAGGAPRAPEAGVPPRPPGGPPGPPEPTATPPAMPGPSMGPGMRRPQPPITQPDSGATKGPS